MFEGKVGVEKGLREARVNVMMDLCGGVVFGERC